MADEPDGHNAALLALKCLVEAVVTDIHRPGRKSPAVSLLAAFLEVCMEEGLSVEEYANRTELPRTTMSKYLLDLADRNQRMKPGLGLITSTFNRIDRRKRDYILTERGRALRDKLL
jgi:hypothetical protein